MSEAFSVTFHALIIKFCYTKALEWSSFFLNLLWRSRIDTFHHKLSLLLPSIFPNISSVQFSCSVMSDSLWRHGLQHTTPPCPSPTPGIYWNSCSLSQWCHPIICHPILPPSIFPSIRVFSSESVLLIRWAKYGVSALASVLPVNIQNWFPWRLIGLISFQSKGLSRNLLQHHSSKASILRCSAFFIV